MNSWIDVTVRSLLIVLFASALVFTATSVEANHGSPTYCDRARNRILNDPNIVLLSGQLKWIMDQRVCVYDSVTRHWKLTTVNTCAYFIRRVYEEAPFYLTPYEKSHIRLAFEC
jgi:hypothetical protein